VDVAVAGVVGAAMPVVTVVAMATMVAASSFGADPVAGGTSMAFAFADTIDIWLIRVA
jgi:hypothetical protein